MSELGSMAGVSLGVSAGGTLALEFANGSTGGFSLAASVCNEERVRYKLPDLCFPWCKTSEGDQYDNTKYVDEFWEATMNE